MKIILFFISIFLVFIDFSQQDFNEYKTLIAKGEIPSDFSSQTSDKIKNELNKDTKNNLSKNQQKIFFEGIYYGIDQLLHSGMVVYGDEISEYVSKIAEKLIGKTDRELFKQLRFYTIKSNEVNALSTNQGIVFVTTGLISQLANEAQLAYVLGHEIAHYKEKHVIEAFEFKNKNYQNGIKQMSVYSKEHEIEADKLGLKYYFDAGYSKTELLATFDVLMYSYLPFDEIEFPKNYFNNDLFYIPEKFFPTKKYEIKAVEDYDDSESSHPNIKTRKTEVLKEIEALKSWGNDVYKFGFEKFQYIRNLSRFESVRTDILEAKYADALYSIFLLEKEYPSSIYLNRMKAHTWLGFAQYKNAGSINETVLKNSELEGEIAALHYLIKQLKNEALITLALREIKNILTKYPNDKEINAIWERMLILIASTGKFDIDKYAEIRFNDAAENFLRNQNNTNKEIKTEEHLNKYEKIKNKKNKIDPSVFDSSQFYYYGITDLIKDENFKKKYYNLSDSINKENIEIEKYNELTIKQKKLIEKEKYLNRKKITEFILVEPNAISYRNGKIDYQSSDKLEKKYTEAINDAGNELGISIYNINNESLVNIGTIGFNERNTLTNFLMQLSNNDKVDILPVDYQYLKEIENNYGTSKIIFTIVEHTYKPEFSFSALYLIFYPPALISYLPIPFIKGNQTELNLLVLDTEKAIIENSFSFYLNDPINKLTLKARMYDIFQTIDLN
jgi:predicted Zn-dependent protease